MDKKIAPSVDFGLISPNFVAQLLSFGYRRLAIRVLVVASMLMYMSIFLYISLKFHPN
jgi:hypothetical protein